MIEVIEVLFSLFPPLLLLVFGWSIKRVFFPGVEGYAFNFLVSLLLGTATFVFPFILLGGTVGMLRVFIIAYSLLGLFLLILQRKPIIALIKPSYNHLVKLLNCQDLLGWFAFVSFLFYVLKTAFYCLLGPIVSGDALYFWLSMAKVFYNLDSIPVFDTYHFWNYSAEPLSSSLFSWGYFIVGNTDLEVFRGISIIFFVAIPIVAYEIARTWSNQKKAGQIALVVACFMPMLDYMLVIYSFYADAIAVVFVGTSIIIMKKTVLRGSARLSFLAGLSIALTLLTKYHYGLITGVIVIIGILTLIGDTKWKKGIIACFTLSLILLMIIAGNAMWSFASNPLSLVILCMLACIVLWARTIDNLELFHIYESKSRVLVSLLAGVSFSLIWGIRTLLQGASLFGIPFLRLASASEQNLALSSILGSIFQSSETASRFTLLTPIGFIVHPLMNGFFSLVILVVFILAAKENRKNISVLWILLIWYIGYLTIMGYFPSGRQLLPCAVFLGPLFGISLTVFKRDSTEMLSNGKLLLITAVFAISSLLQMVSTNLAWNALGAPNIPGLPSVSIPYTTSFGLLTTPELVYKTIIVAITILTVLLICIFFIQKPNLKMKHRYAKIIAILSLVLSSTLVVPVSIHALSVTSGDLLNYDFEGSWNRADFMMGEYLLGVVNQNEIILAFGDIVLSYMGFRILDMYHSGLYAIPTVAFSQNISVIHNELWSFGIRIMVLPDNSSYLASTYWRLISYIPFPEIVAKSNASILLREMAHWRIYELVQPEF